MSGEFKSSLQVEIIIMDRVCLVADRATLHILSGHTHTQAALKSEGTDTPSAAKE